MKFIHIADVHLGAVPDSNMPWAGERQKEIWESFKNIINICNEEKVDLLLIAGDLFHKQPLVRELKEVDYYFSTLNTAQVVIIAGNHDYMGPRSNYLGFQWTENVHMFYGNTVEHLVLDKINTTVYGFSYHTRDITESIYDDLKPLDTQGRHILLAHGGDEKSVPINRRKLMNSGFDYIALGHIHKPEIFGGMMAYSGSLEPLDKNEVGARGYIIGEIDKDREFNKDREGGNDREIIKNREEDIGREINKDRDSKVKIRFVPCSLREYKRLIITIDQETTHGALEDIIKDKIDKNGKEHIYMIRIEGFRDEDIGFDKEAIFSLGNILEVIDDSHPDYDFDNLYKENSDNMIGMFIKRIRESDNQNEVTKKALYYGIEALLESRDKNAYKKA
ncbi:MAG: DNA repair exonuclease [Clostridiales bacterium]|nr:DNA repair exonuclease [Clostridiales bacterium]